MTVNELIQQLQNLPKDVRKRPIMDSEPNVEDWLARLEHISVAKVIVDSDGACAMVDPELTDEENVTEMEARYNVPMHVEQRVLTFFE